MQVAKSTSDFQVKLAGFAPPLFRCYLFEPKRQDGFGRELHDFRLTSSGWFL